jgi:hypothetical protein
LESRECEARFFQNYLNIRIFFHVGSLQACIHCFQ